MRTAAPSAVLGYTLVARNFAQAAVTAAHLAKKVTGLRFSHCIISLTIPDCK
jgi:hypothetical protein